MNRNSKRYQEIELSELRVVMLRRGLTYRDLAKSTNRAPQTIANLLSGSDRSWPVRAALNRVLKSKIFSKPERRRPEPRYNYYRLGTLTKGNFLKLPAGKYLVSGCCFERVRPAFTEVVVGDEQREAQWGRIRAARLANRKFFLFDDEAQMRLSLPIPKTNKPK